MLEAHLGKIIKVDMKAELFSYAIDEDALRLAEMMDGKLLVVTNVQDMAPDKVIERYSVSKSSVSLFLRLVVPEHCLRLRA